MLAVTGAIVGSSVLIVVIAALRPLLRRRVSARVVYALWALVLLRLLLPFSIELGAPSAEAAVRTVYERAEPAVQAVPAQAAPAAPDIDFTGVQTDKPSVSAPVQAGTVTEAEAETETGAAAARPAGEYLKLAWVCGSLAALLLFAGINLSFYLRLRRSRRPTGKSEAGLRVFECGAVASPCLFGLFRPAIYFRACDREHFRYVLEHEDCHYRHLDHVWAILRSACLVVYWWDPLVWLAAALSRTDCELACDEAVLARLGEGERRAYGETLISLAAKPRPAELLCASSPIGAGRRELRQRISAIARGRRKLVIPALLAAALCLFCAACAFSPAGEEETPGAAEGYIADGTAFSRPYGTAEDWSYCGEFVNDTDGSGVTLIWRSGESAHFSFLSDEERQSAGYFLSGTVNALAYVDADRIVVRTGEGTEPEGWAESLIEPGMEDASGCLLGFAGAQDGWLLITDDAAVFEVYVTSDGGASWELLCSGEADSAISGALFVPDGLGILCLSKEAGEAAELKLTRDGGESWEPLILPSAGSSVLTPRLTEDGIVLAVQSADGAVRDYHTYEYGGESWRGLSPMEQDDFDSLAYRFGDRSGSTAGSDTVAAALDILSFDEWEPSDAEPAEDGRLTLTLTGPGAPARLETCAQDLALCLDTGEVYAMPEGSHEALLELLGAGGVEPSDIQGLASATLDGMFGQSITLTDAGVLADIEALLSASQPCQPTDAVLGAQLRLELEDGGALTLELAGNGSPVWRSEGEYYSYEGEDDFALIAPFAQFVLADEDTPLETHGGLVDYLDWTQLSKTYGSDAAMALIDRLYENALAGGEGVYRYVSAMRGLDGAMAENYASKLVELYDAESAQVATYIMSLPEAEREDAVWLLAYGLSYFDEVERSELETLLGYISGTLAPETRNVYLAEGFGREGYALLLTGEAVDGEILGFRLYCSQLWDECSGQGDVQNAVEATFISGGGRLTGGVCEFRASYGSATLTGRLSLTDGAAEISYASLVTGQDGASLSCEDGEFEYSLTLPTRFTQRGTGELTALWQELPYFSNETVQPVPLRTTQAELEGILGLPVETLGDGNYWTNTYAGLTLSGWTAVTGDRLYVGSITSSDPERLPSVRGITLGMSADEVLARFPSRVGSYAELVAAYEAYEVVFYGSQSAFYGGYGCFRHSGDYEPGEAYLQVYQGGEFVRFYLDKAGLVTTIRWSEAD